MNGSFLILFRIGLFLLIILGFVACKKENGVCLSGFGTDTQKHISLDSFSEIDLRGRIKYRISHSDSNYASVTFGDKTIDGITFKLENNVLTIDDENRCTWIRKLDKYAEVTIYTSNLEVVRDFSHISTQIDTGTTADVFYYEQWDAGAKTSITTNISQIFLKQNTGIGDITINGQVDYLYGFNAANGNLNAENLNAQTALIFMAGSGFMRVKVAETLDARVNKTGDIYYNASVQNLIKEENGKGRVIPYN